MKYKLSAGELRELCDRLDANLQYRNGESYVLMEVYNGKLVIEQPCAYHECVGTVLAVVNPYKE